MEPLGEALKRVRPDLVGKPPDCEACKDEGAWGKRYDLGSDGGAVVTSADVYCIACGLGRQVAAEIEAAKLEVVQAKIARNLARLQRHLPPGQAGYTLKSYVESGGLAQVAHLAVEWLDTPPTSFFEGDQPWQPWLYIGGSVGAGKTGLAVPLVLEFTRRGLGSGDFIVVSDWLQTLRDQYGKQGVPDSEMSPMYVYQDIDLLVLDDLGVERNTDWSTEILFGLINYRATHRKRTVITANLTLDDLRSRLDTGDRGRRIPSRIQEMCWGDRWVWSIEGRDLRGRQRVG